MFTYVNIAAYCDVSLVIGKLRHSAKHREHEAGFDILVAVN